MTDDTPQQPSSVSISRLNEMRSSEDPRLKELETPISPEQEQALDAMVADLIPRVEGFLAKLKSDPKFAREYVRRNLSQQPQVAGVGAGVGQQIADAFSDEALSTDE